jgi:hypothetical protein
VSGPPSPHAASASRRMGSDRVIGLGVRGAGQGPAVAGSLPRRTRAQRHGGTEEKR